MYEQQMHGFTDHLGMVYSFTFRPLFNDSGELRDEACIRCKTYARQLFDSISEGYSDPFNYKLMDLWLTAYQKPWAQPRQLRKLIADLAAKIASGEMFVYLEDAPHWHHPSLKQGRTAGAVAGSEDKGAADTPRTQNGSVQRAPEPAQAALATGESATAVPDLPRQPQSLDDAQRILAMRRSQLISDGYQQKYTDEELLAIAEKGEVNDRFLVRLISSDPASVRSTSLGFPRPSGRAPYWATTFDLAEAADTDPELLAALFGIDDYSPDKDYSVAVIDMERMPVQAERETFVPTYAKMAGFGNRELGPKEGFGPDTMSQIMTPEASREYAGFRQAYNQTGNNPYNEKNVERAIRKSTADAEKKVRLATRYKVELEFGANPLFTGNGLTKVDTKSRYAGAIGQSYGVAETFTFERDPLTITELEECNAVKVLPAKPTRA